MIQTVAIKQGRTRVVSCEPVEGLLLSEELNAFVSVWGIKASFSDGQTVIMQDLCTNRDYIEILVKRLSGASLSPAFLQYIIEDFLEEIYG